MISLTFGFTATALGVLSHLWQSSIVGLAVLVLALVARRLPAWTRCALAWLGLAKFAVPAVWWSSFSTPAGSTARTWLTVDALTLPVTAPSSAVLPASATSPTATLISIWSLLAIAWFAVAILLIALWLARGIRAQRRLLTHATPLPATLATRVTAAANRVGLRHPPRAVLAPTESSACVAGLWRPVLVLPHGLAEALTPAELDVILLHECVHVQRGDNLWHAVRAAFVAAFWFNPVVWLLSRLLARETEIACDERVLALTGDPDTYARSILAAVRHALGATQPGFAAATTPPVVARVHRILAQPVRPSRPAALAVMSLAAACVVLSGRAGSLSPAPSSSSAQPRGELKLGLIDSVSAQFGTLPPKPSIADLDQMFGSPKMNLPVPLNFPPPKYPAEALAEARSGRVVVEALVGLDGQVRQARIGMSTDPVFNRSALEAAKRWTFQPAAANGVRVLAVAKIPIDFYAKPSASGYVGLTRVWTNEQVLTEILSSPAATASQPVPDRDSATLSIDFPDQPIREIVRRVADLFELKVIMPDTLQGRATIELRDVTWRQIFERVLESAGHTFIIDADRTVRIVPRDTRPPSPDTSPVK